MVYSLPIYFKVSHNITAFIDWPQSLCKLFQAFLTLSCKQVQKVQIYCYKTLTMAASCH